MPCSECTERARLIAESERLYRDKRVEYQHLFEATASRLIAPYLHQLKQARANLERHMAECTEEK